MSEVATTSGASFVGADVDGLDHLAQEFTGAAEIVDTVKLACEVVVAAASIFGPFGAAFVAYLKATVIPWLTKVSAALTAMSKVLSMHSTAQRDASSSTTSLPTYTGTPNLPATSTHDAPALPPAATTATPTTSPAPTGPGSTIAGPPAIGGTTATTPATTTGTTAGQPVTPTDPGTTVPGTAPALGNTGGIDLSPLHPLHPGDTVGVLSVPVDIAPDGTVTPLIHTPLDPTPSTPSTPATPAAPATPADTAPAPAAIAPAAHHVETQPTPSSTSRGGPAGGSGGGYSGGGSSGDSGAPIVTSAPPAAAATTAVHTAIPAATHAEPGLRPQTIGSHDALFSGIGQATGIGAGAAALARAVLSEARQSSDGSVLGAVALPFDADAAARTEIFQGSIG